jgi:hypothetical protein
MNEMLFKNTKGGSIKDVDTAKGIVTGYFSIFGNKDSDGDIIMPGAFAKTIQENGPKSQKPRILHLLQHDTWKPLAKPTTLEEDAKGLYFESLISKTSYGRDTLQLYLDGVLTEHSIGFNTIKREVDETTETTKLLELKLWEGSTVSWGANMEAMVTGMKSLDKKTLYDALIKKMSALQKAVKGNYTDETAYQLEIELLQIQQMIKSLSEIDEPDSTQVKEEPMTAVEAKELLIKHLR